jgi:hypothetical protein
MTPTILREGHGLGVYFLTYELLVQTALSRLGKERKDLSSTMVMLFGASAGVAVSVERKVLLSRLKSHCGPLFAALAISLSNRVGHTTY